MVNKILNAITKRLGTTFGDTYHYYVEDVEQGFTKPCFTVDLLNPMQRSKSAVLYDRTMPMVIHFFSDSKENLKNKLYSMSEQIIECLEYLPFENGLIRGEDISWQIVDNEVLQIFVTYKFTTILETTNEDAFETIENTVKHINI